MMSNHQQPSDLLSDMNNTMSMEQKLEWAIAEIERMRKIMNMPVDVVATDVRIYGMNDNHTFIRYLGNIDDIIQKWKSDYSTKGTSLCPAVVIGNGKELRRVGCMVFRPSDTMGISQWISAIKEDPDIQRLWEEKVNIAAPYKLKGDGSVERS